MLYWKSHIDQPLPKLSAASYVITVLKAFVTQDTLVMGLTFIRLWIMASFSRVILNTYLLTPWSRVLLEKPTASADSQEIPRIFGTRRFITVLAKARHLSLSWANSIQSPQPPPTSWRSILILSSHLFLGLPYGLFPSGFPIKTLCTPPPYSPHAPPISFYSILPPAQYSVGSTDY